MIKKWRSERARAQAALEQSRRQLEDAERRAPEVDELVAQLQHQARVNHFVERLNMQWGKP